MGMPSETVMAKAREVFPDDQVDAVSRILDQFGPHPLTHQDRVQLAILTLADSDVARVQGFTDVAKTDFRDVLYWVSQRKE